MWCKPKLRSHLRLDVVAPDLVVVRSESDTSILEGRLLPLLAPYLDGEHTIADIVGELAGRAHIVDVRFGLSLLEEKGYLVEGHDEARPDMAAFRDVLGLDPGPFGERLAGTAVEVVALGSLRPEPLVTILESLGVRVAVGGENLVVLAEDYLQPRLAEIARRELASGRPWLLVKPLGAVPWVGPLMRPPETGCWICLADRLAANRPYRALLSSSGEFDAVPAPTLPSTLHLALHAAATQVLRWVGAGHHPELEDRLITLDVRTLAGAGHRLVRRPWCPYCGAAPPASERTPEPIRLQPAHRSFTTDGGYRTVPPDRVYQRLAHHISPITGIVGSVRDDGDATGAVRGFVADHQFPSHDEREALRTGQRHLSAGKGMGADQARASALCEALERYSGVLRGDEPRITARFTDLGPDAIHPNACAGFSSTQYREREHWNEKGWRYSWVPVPFEEERAIEWSPLWSLTEGRFKYLPTAFCYYSVPLPRDHRFCIADSNGNAAGSCLEEAILQGFLELIERDAVATWWYNRLPRPGVALASFERPYFAALADHYRGLDREIHVLDITHDFGIPAFAAISWAASAERSDVLLGFGAHFDVEIAVARALTEMNQFLPGLVAGRERRILSETVQDFTYLEPAATERRREEYPRAASRDLREDVLDLIERARARGLETLVLDQTRPDVGLRVVKVVVPGLRHYWPRWGPGRLYDVPVALGWLEKPRQEDELNRVHLLI